MIPPALGLQHPAPFDRFLRDAREALARSPTECAFMLGYLMCEVDRGVMLDAQREALEAELQALLQACAQRWAALEEAHAQCVRHTAPKSGDWDGKCLECGADISSVAYRFLRFV
jgi:hypothetical protein